mgnify:CR=1 FL=1
MLIGLFAGAVPFAVILGKVASGKDIRQIADGNPGAANAWKAAGRYIGLVAVAIEILKGAVPVLLAMTIGGLAGWELCAIGFSPVVGHAFSPFLRFRGGKAIAATAGVWAGLTPWGLGFPIACLCLAPFHFLQRVHAWTVVLGFTLFGIIVAMIWLRHDYLVVLWAMQLALIIFKHKSELRKPPSPRRWTLQLRGSQN